MINNETFNLYMEIIFAAKDNRYMHGNGRYYYILDAYNNKVCIDVLNGSKVLVPEYNASQAHTSMDTVRILEEFLIATDAAPVYTSEQSYTNARDMVAKAARNNNLLYTNGNQCYINECGTVLIVELGVRTWNNSMGYVAQVHCMSLHAAWKYLKFNGVNTRVELTESLKNWLAIR